MRTVIAAAVVAAVAIGSIAVNPSPSHAAVAQKLFGYQYVCTAYAFGENRPLSTTSYGVVAATDAQADAAASNFLLAWGQQLERKHIRYSRTNAQRTSKVPLN